MQRHHRALAETDQRESANRRGRGAPAPRRGRRRAPAAPIDAAVQRSSAPARIVGRAVALEREPLPAHRRAGAALGRVRRDEGGVRQQRAPLLAELDQILAVGAVAVQEHHELRGAGRSWRSQSGSGQFRRSSRRLRVTTVRRGSGLARTRPASAMPERCLRRAVIGPEHARRDAAPGPPALGDLLEPPRVGPRLQPERELAPPPARRGRRPERRRDGRGRTAERYRPSRGRCRFTATSARCASSASSAPSARKVEAVVRDRLAPARAARGSSASKGRSRAERRPRRRSKPAASSGATRASSRPKIALALATETCCETMIAARPAKPGSRRRSGGGPPIAISRATSSGSSASRLRAASARAASSVDRRAGMIDARPGAAGSARCAWRGLPCARRRFVASRFFAAPLPPPRFASSAFSSTASPRPPLARPSLRALAERRAASRPRLFGALQRALRRAQARRTPAAAHRRSRPDPLQARIRGGDPRRPCLARRRLRRAARAARATRRRLCAGARASRARRASSIPASARAAEIAAGDAGARDPDGAPLHRGRCRAVAGARARARLAAGRTGRAPARHGRARSRWRPRGSAGANLARATSRAAVAADAGRLGRRRAARQGPRRRAIIWRSSSTTRLQGVTDIVRGRDLYAATSVHRLLQALLGCRAPRYRHHRLVLDPDGGKLSKSAARRRSRALREAG